MLLTVSPKPLIYISSSLFSLASFSPAFFLAIPLALALRILRFVFSTRFSNFCLFSFPRSRVLIYDKSLAFFSEILPLRNSIACFLRTSTLSLFALYLSIIVILFSFVSPKSARNPIYSFLSPSFFSIPLFLDILKALFLFRFPEFIRRFLSSFVRLDNVAM